MSRTADPQLSIDFVNTVDWRTDPVRHQELLSNIGDLIRWAQEHGLVSDAGARRLAQHAHQHPRVAGQFFDRSIVLRDAIYRVFSAASAGSDIPAADLEIISHEFRQAAQHLRLATSGGDFHWEWSSEGDVLDPILWKIAHSTVELLTSDLLERIRECEGRGCGWIILDTTRNRSKRWCNMKSCGNRAKVRRFYERHKQETSSK